MKEMFVYKMDVLKQVLQYCRKAIRRKPEKEKKMETMTTEEMQRFLNREAEKGSSEYEALKALVEILEIEFPKLKREAE